MDRAGNRLRNRTIRQERHFFFALISQTLSNIGETNENRLAGRKDSTHISHFGERIFSAFTSGFTTVSASGDSFNSAPCNGAGHDANALEKSVDLVGLLGVWPARSARGRWRCSSADIFSRSSTKRRALGIERALYVVQQPASQVAPMVYRLPNLTGSHEQHGQVHQADRHLRQGRHWQVNDDVQHQRALSRPAAVLQIAAIPRAIDQHAARRQLHPDGLGHATRESAGQASEVVFEVNGITASRRAGRRRASAAPGAIITAVELLRGLHVFENLKWTSNLRRPGRRGLRRVCHADPRGIAKHVFTVSSSDSWRFTRPII